MVIDSDFSAGVRLTIALFHFLWVGTLIGGASAVAGRLLKRRPANLRYIVHLAALSLTVIAVPALYVAAPWITPRALFTPGGSNSRIGDNRPPPQFSQFPPRDFVPESVRIQESSNSQISPTAHDLGNTTDAATTVGTSLGSTSTAPPILNSAVPYVVGLYAVGVWCMLARLAVGLWGGHRLRLLSSPVLDSSLLEMVRRQAARLRLATVPALVWCDRTVVPVVVGIARPVILLPVAIATNLRPELIESLLSHELAHIRRWDLAVNLMQRLIEALLFFHPAVWYLSSRVSAERENACDDLVLCAGWPRLHYAEALLQMAECVTSRPGAAAFTAAGLVAATGESNSQFKRRVLRLLGHEESARLGWSRGGVSVLLVVAAIVVGIPLAVSAWNGPNLQEKAPTSPQPNGNQAQALGDPVGPREESPEDAGQSPPKAAERDPIDEQLDRIGNAKWENDERLNRELFALDQMRNQATVAEIEERGAALLDQFPEPEAAARINHQLAHVFAQRNIRDHAVLVAKYVARSLEIDRHPDRRALAMGYLASAVSLDPAVTSADERRRNATRIWLKNYRELLAFKLPKNAPDLPGVGGNRPDPGADAAEIDRLKRRAAAQLRARRKAELIRSLVYHKEVCARLVVEAYRFRDKSEDEMRGLAIEVLKDPEVAHDLIRQGIALKVGEDRPEIHWIEDPPNSPSGLAIEVFPAGKVERTATGLKLSLRIANRSAHDLTTIVPHEWHGGEWARTNLYASVTPQLRIRQAAFEPAYLFGENEGKAAEPLTVEAGKSVDIEVRMDWPGTGSVIGSPFLTGDQPGVYRVRFALAFESHNGFQYVVSPTGLVTLSPEGGKNAGEQPPANPRGEPAPERSAKTPEVELKAAVEPIPDGVLIAAKVVDAETNEPIASFRALPGTPFTLVKSPEDPCPAVWQPHLISDYSAGKFAWPKERSYAQFRLRFEAEGYVPGLTLWLKKEDGPQSIVVKLKKDPGIAGQILAPDGRPASGAVLAIALPNRGIRLNNGQVEGVGATSPKRTDPVRLSDRWRQPVAITADAEGKYRLPTETGTAVVYAVHDAGIAEVTYLELAKSIEIRLRGWGSISGRVEWLGKPAGKETLAVLVNRDMDGYPEGCSASWNVVSDEEGRFQVERVPPWQVQISRVTPLPGENAGSYWFPNLHAHIAEGRPTVVVFGKGRTVQGKLTGRDSYKGVTLSLSPRPPRIGGDSSGFNSIGEGPLRPVFNRSQIPVQEDGSFEIAGVVPERYLLSVQVKEKSLQVTRVTVPSPKPEDEGQPFQIEEIKLKTDVEPKTDASLKTESVREKLARKQSFAISGKLLFVLDELEKLYGVPVTVSLKEILEREIDPQADVSVKVTDVPLSELFEKVAQAAGLDVEFNEKGVRIPKVKSKND